MSRIAGADSSPLFLAAGDSGADFSKGLRRRDFQRVHHPPANREHTALARIGRAGPMPRMTLGPRIQPHAHQQNVRQRQHQQQPVEPLRRPLLQQRCPIRLCRKPNPLRRLFWSRNVCSILIRRPYLPCAKYAVREQKRAVFLSKNASLRPARSINGTAIPDRLPGPSSKTSTRPDAWASPKAITSGFLRLLSSFCTARRPAAPTLVFVQPFLAPFEQLLEDAPHGLGHFHPIVVGEAPQAFDLVLEHDGALGLQGNGRQADPPDPQGRRHEQGKRTTKGRVGFRPPTR